MIIMMYDDSTMMCDNVRLCMMIDSRIRGNWIVMLMLMLWVSTICIICISKTSMTFTQIPSANHGINKSHLIQILHQDLFRTKLLALLKQRNATNQTTRKWCPFWKFPKDSILEISEEPGFWWISSVQNRETTSISMDFSG